MKTKYFQLIKGEQARQQNDIEKEKNSRYQINLSAPQLWSWNEIYRFEQVYCWHLQQQLLITVLNSLLCCYYVPFKSILRISGQTIFVTMVCPRRFLCLFEQIFSTWSIVELHSTGLLCIRWRQSGSMIYLKCWYNFTRLVCNEWFVEYSTTYIKIYMNMYIHRYI